MQKCNKAAARSCALSRARVFRVPFACATFVILGAQMDTARAQSVAIQNVSYPGTALEVGETVGISISGGTPGSSVTVNINGTLYSVGTTDGSGNWSTTSSITSGFADTDWTEHWYVNGTETTPSNSDLLFAPTLPVFPTTVTTPVRTAAVNFRAMKRKGAARTSLCIGSSHQ